jgi:GMP synthase (glutamine-hydrolysing)
LTAFERLLETLRETVDVGHPTVASCFGYQLLVHALGGEIIHDPPRTEVGSYEMVLTAEARDDELFTVLPDRFLAQLGHKSGYANYESQTERVHAEERFRESPEVSDLLSRFLELVFT